MLDSLVEDLSRVVDDNERELNAVIGVQSRSCGVWQEDLQG